MWHIPIYTYTMEYYSAITKKETLTFAITCVNLEDITISEISQTQKAKYCMISLVCDSNILKLIDCKRRMIVARGWGEGEVGKC